MAVDIKTTCRDISELAPVAQKAIRLFFYECYKAGIAIFVTETYRSQERQNYLYAQGRTRPGNIVTWTLNSNHKSRLAWDIGAATLNGNSNIYNSVILKKAGAIASNLGITWGGTWTNNLDYPHFEVKSNWTIPKGYSLDGIVVSIPTRSNIPITVTNSVSKLPKVPLVVDDKDLEEELIMAQKVTLKDISSPTLRTSAINFIKMAMDAGRITDSKWLKAAEDGTLPVDELTLLYIHTNLVGPVIAQSTTPALQKEFTEFIREASPAPHGDGTVSSTKWLEQAEKGTLTVADATLLKGVIDHRREPKG